MLEARGMIVVPESNSEIDEAIRWYYSTITARAHDYMAGLIMKLTWEDVKSLTEYEPSFLPTRDLAAYSFVIDSVYLEFLVKNKEESK